MCFFENVTMTNEQLQERYSHVTTAGTNDPRLAPLMPGTLRWCNTRGRGCQRQHLVPLCRLIHHWFHSTAAAVSPTPLPQNADPTQDTPSRAIKSLSATRGEKPPTTTLAFIDTPTKQQNPLFPQFCVQRDVFINRKRLSGGGSRRVIPRDMLIHHQSSVQVPKKEPLSPNHPVLP